MKRIDAYWYSQNPVAWLLLPAAALYCLLVFIRRVFFRAGIFKCYKLSAPVIIVGNITVGGTGKTPLLIALCELLKSQGYKPGVISRGYGGDFDGERLVADSDRAELIGDEPCLIHARTGCPMVVGSNRVAAAKLLLAESDCNIILSDDGLQHYRLQRDIEIAIVDNNRQFGNGFCLPSGPLREPVSRLRQVDIVVDHYSAAKTAIREDNFTLKFSDAVSLKTNESMSLDDFRGAAVHAVAGIGHPKRFFDQLSREGLDVIEHELPDHHKFTGDDLQFNDSLDVLMTEKDAVKCQGFSADTLWYVPVTAELSKSFRQKLLSKANQLSASDS
ncbi:tetraacyldisaccharide 4'-kinase [Pseudomonadota bacterium]